LKDLKGKSIHIVGVSGMEGAAAAEFLLSKGARIIGHDFIARDRLKENFFSLHDYLDNQKKEQEWQKFMRTDPELRLGNNYLTDIEKADLIFVPQAWFRYDFNLKLKKLKGRIPFIGILDLYFSFSKARIVGVTGSCGKTTTTRLTYEIIRREKRALISGNDRDLPPVIDKAEKLGKDDYLILEISNRQLIDFNQAPEIGVITNLFPTHLDDHPSFKAYKYVKLNLIRSQSKDQKAVLNLDDEEVMDLSSYAPGRKFFFSLRREPERGSYLKRGQGYWIGEKEPVIKFDQVKIPGPHNRANILAAVTVAKIVGIKNRNIRNACYSFKGLKHRLEFVKAEDGVQYYNDSQSTNSLSTVAAIRSFKQPIILIAGGKAKPNPKDFNILAEEMMAAKNLKALFLIGQSAGQIKRELVRQSTEKERSGLRLKICRKLSEAVEEARRVARPSDIVLLSPASESFGEFKDYRERGREFKRLVR